MMSMSCPQDCIVSSQCCVCNSCVEKWLTNPSNNLDNIVDFTRHIRSFKALHQYLKTFNTWKNQPSRIFKAIISNHYIDVDKKNDLLNQLKETTNVSPTLDVIEYLLVDQNYELAYKMLRTKGTISNEIIRIVSKTVNHLATFQQFCELKTDLSIVPVLSGLFERDDWKSSPFETTKQKLLFSERVEWQFVMEYVETICQKPDSIFTRTNELMLTRLLRHVDNVNRLVTYTKKMGWPSNIMLAVLFLDCAVCERIFVTSSFNEIVRFQEATVVCINSNIHFEIKSVSDACRLVWAVLALGIHRPFKELQKIYFKVLFDVDLFLDRLPNEERAHLLSKLETVFSTALSKLDPLNYVDRNYVFELMKFLFCHGLLSPNLVGNSIWHWTDFRADVLQCSDDIISYLPLDIFESCLRVLISRRFESRLGVVPSKYVNKWLPNVLASRSTTEWVEANHCRRAVFYESAKRVYYLSLILFRESRLFDATVAWPTIFEHYLSSFLKEPTLDYFSSDEDGSEDQF